MCQNIFDYHNKKDDKEQLQEDLRNESQELSVLGRTSPNNLDNKDDGWEVKE